MERITASAWQALSEHHGLRAALAGVALVIIGLLLGAESAVAVALIAVGVVMLVVGWAGRRLRGRLAIEFGPEGTTIELQAHVASPVRPRPPAIQPPETPAAPRIYALSRRDPATPAAAASPAGATTGGDAGQPPDAEVIEGTGETIEMDVSQLKALLAAERTNGSS